MITLESHGDMSLTAPRTPPPPRLPLLATWWELTILAQCADTAAVESGVFLSVGLLVYLRMQCTMMISGVPLIHAVT